VQAWNFLRLGSRFTFLSSASRQDEVEGAALAEDDRRVAVEARIALDGLGHDPREPLLRLQ